MAPDSSNSGFVEIPVTTAGDGDLLALNPFRQSPIVAPATFVQGVAR
jgi:hypothetical protein